MFCHAGKDEQLHKILYMHIYGVQQPACWKPHPVQLFYVTLVIFLVATSAMFKI